ncbi:MULTISPECIES: hypothetical protein [Pelistega]|uniref:hypothetical protein n=1 Tax=Pelistega TaxID=106146 RepID=UPI000410177F|nr:MULTISPECIES: hypothetical protein [Pelistega]
MGASSTITNVRQNSDVVNGQVSPITSEQKFKQALPPQLQVSFDTRVAHSANGKAGNTHALCGKTFP